MFKCFINFVILLILYSNRSCVARRSFEVCQILNGVNDEEEIAFRASVDRANVYERSFQLRPHVAIAKTDDSFDFEKIVCDLISRGCIAIFGPSSHAAGVVSSMANHFSIPHILYHWQPEETDAERIQRRMTLNVFPSTNQLSNGYSLILKTLLWQSFTVVYEYEEDLIQLQDVLQLRSRKHPIVLRQLPTNNDYGPLLKSIKSNAEAMVVLHCNPKKIVDVLKVAQKMNIFSEYQSFFTSKLDAHAAHYSELGDNYVNITTIRLMDPSDSDVETAVHDWDRTARRLGKILDDPAPVKTNMVLIHDALMIFAKALKDMNIFDNIEAPNIDCRRPHEPQWAHGQGIVEFIKQRSTRGLTGDIEFNDFGERSNFRLRLLQLVKNGYNQILVWDPVRQFTHIFAASQGFQEQVNATVHGKNFMIASKLDAPYLIERRSTDGSIFEGNARYEGYALDLLDNIAQLAGFTYTFYTVEASGTYNKVTKKWDGLVKEILDKKADFAICDFTMTSLRRTAIDFSVPFMTLGISILFSKVEPKEPDLFSFLLPFSSSVWAYTATVFLAVSILILILTRIAKNDWENPHPCNEEPEELENIWSIPNACWLAMGSLMGQGCDLLPKATPSRLVAGVWWFFALMMLNSYTANLAAFLTMSRMENVITSAEDLSKQTQVKYGCVKGGSTETFFKESNNSIYQKMYAAMENAKPTVFEVTNQKGVERVLRDKGKFAFMMESTTIQYTIERNCNLMQVGDLLDFKSYGIGMPINSPYRSLVNEAILKLGESGKLEQLKNKWWKKMHGGGQCDNSVDAKNDSRLGTDNVGGVFVVLASGLFVAILIGIAEFMWNVRKVAVEEKVTPFEAFKSELKFALKFWVTHKPVRITDTDGSGSSSTPKRSMKSRSRAVSETRSARSNIGNTEFGLSMKSLHSETRLL